MQPTSHFIGVLVDSTPFVNLFVALQRYFELHKLTDVIEFQNVLSLHITLYYLDAALTQDKRDAVLTDVAELSVRYPLIKLGKLSTCYFGETGNERVCYAGSVPNQTLKSMNTFFAEKYQNSDIVDNQFDFVSHISLFRIREPGLYQPHKAALDTLISDELSQIGDHVLPGEVRLFQVSSLYHPEIQLVVA